MRVNVALAQERDLGVSEPARSAQPPSCPENVGATSNSHNHYPRVARSSELSARVDTRHVLAALAT
jgi:hypothetical protein